MKNLLFTFVLAITSLFSFGQETPKSDVILKQNGEEMSGKVQEITDDVVKFIYTGETLVYTIKKTEIVKITFSSGRIEMINPPTTPADAKSDSLKAAAGLQAHHNKVAILPFSYLINKQNAGEEMTYKAQSVAYTYINTHAGYLEVLPVQTTNALLLKAGITAANLRSFSIPELCNLLGVEYIVIGNVIQDLTSVSTYNSGASTYNGRSNNGRNYSGTTFSSSSSSSEQNYQTEVTISVYSDKGETLFSQNRTSFWNTTDAYEITIQYLLKRTPIYHK